MKLIGLFTAMGIWLQAMVGHREATPRKGEGRGAREGERRREDRGGRTEEENEGGRKEAGIRR